MVTVIDMKSGNLWLVIDTGIETSGLRITEDKIIVVSKDKAITWDLPTRGCVCTVRKNNHDSIQTTTFNHSLPITSLTASISPNLNYVAFGSTKELKDNLCIYDSHTGEKLAVVESFGRIPGFTPAGNKVWCATNDGTAEQWEIFAENGSNAIKLKKLARDTEQLNSLPWHSPYGYQVTNDGWILCSNGKHLLWLPHHWRQDEIIQRRWKGKFLAIWNDDLLEPSILELEV